MSNLELLSSIELDIKNGVDTVLIDEAQFHVGWDIVVKQLFDIYVSKGTIKTVVTGSSSLNLTAKDLGIDRTEIMIIPTLSFNEYLQFTNSDKTIENFEHFLSYGGFPGYLKNIITIEELVRKTISPLLNLDIPNQYKIRNNNIVRLVNEIAQLTNGEYDKLNSAGSTMVDTKSIDSYLDILEKSQIIKRVFCVNGKGELGKYPKFKIYINPHFHIALLGKDFSQLDDKFKGHIIESYWLFQDQVNRGLFGEYFYLKTYENLEIDFVFPDPTNREMFKKIIEFKYTNKPAKRITNLHKIKSVEKVIYSKTT